MPIHAHFSAGDFDPNVGQTDLVFGVPSGSLIGLRLQDYKYLCAAVTTCAALVNTMFNLDPLVLGKTRQKLWGGVVSGIWGPPVGSRGEAPVRDLGAKFFCK